MVTRTRCFAVSLARACNAYWICEADGIICWFILQGGWKKGLESGQGMYVEGDDGSWVVSIWEDGLPVDILEKASQRKWDCFVSS